MSTIKPVIDCSGSTSVAKPIQKLGRSTRKPITNSSASILLEPATVERRQALEARCIELSLGLKTEAMYQDGKVHLINIAGAPESVEAVKKEFS